MISEWSYDTMAAKNIAFVRNKSKQIQQNRK